MEGKQVPRSERLAPEDRPTGEEIIEVTKSPEGQPDIEITFLYVTHTLENVDPIWEKVKGADIILLEDAGGAKGPREHNLLSYNMFSDIAQENPNAPAVRLAIKAYRDLKSFTAHLAAKMLEEGGGKEIGYVDVGAEEPIYRETEEALELDTQIRWHVHGGKIGEARKVLPELIKAVAASSAKRENFVADQLKERFKEVKGKKKVAVIQGALHTATCHAIKREGLFLTRSVFVPWPRTLSPVETLVWRKKFFPEEEITEEEYDRALIGDYLVIPGAMELWPEAQFSELEIFANRLARRLSTKKITDLLNKEKKGEFRANCAEIVKELAEKHRVTIKRTPKERTKRSR